MATLDRFNPVESFQRARSNALAIQGQEQGIARETAAAPTRNALADLNLEQSRVGAQRGQTQFTQDQSSKRATIMNQVAKAMLNTPENQWASASQSLNPKLAELGLPPLNAANLSRSKFEQVINETQALITTPSNISSGQRERADLVKAIQPALNEQGQIDVSKLTPGSKSAAIELGLLPRAGTVTGQERIATTPDLTTDVAASQAEIKGAEETAKLTAQKGLLPGIRAAIKLAEKNAVAEGETFTSLNRAKAALPGLEEVTEKLKLLADVATFTTAGKLINLASKELGFGATKGATARSTMRAVVDNQVLPLLRETFGAAFTKAEGDTLRNTLLDPDTTPDQMKATLDAFIEQKVRNIETKERELGLSLPEGVTEDDIETTMQANNMTREQVLERLGSQ